MRARPTDEGDAPWFQALADSAPDVFFRYALLPTPRFDYVSPSVHALTGHTPEAFAADARQCATLFDRTTGKTLRQVLRARRALTVTLRLVDGRTLTMHTAPVIRRHQLTAVEGLVRLASSATRHDDAPAVPAPVQQQLSALLYEVHGLLHAHQRLSTTAAPAVIRLGALLFDPDRMTVSDQGAR